MDIIGIKPNHDGAVAFLSNRKLQFSIEQEKDSYRRHEDIFPWRLAEIVGQLASPPDVLAVGGWKRRGKDMHAAYESGYLGVDESAVVRRSFPFFGHQLRYFSSSHERSHVLCAYGLSPFDQGRPCYLLIWEALLGGFYEIDKDLKIHPLGTPVIEPGTKYLSLFACADPTYHGDLHDFSAAGKLMALAAFSDRSSCTPQESELIRFIMNEVLFFKSSKESFSGSPYFNVGVESEQFKSIAGKFSDHLFNQFYLFAKQSLAKGYPLLVAGGCGLNCEWNSRWRDSGLFSDVFVPPCANDSGSAIGTAIDAQYHYTGVAKVEWDVYAGQEFVHDVSPGSAYLRAEASPDYIAELLNRGLVLAWVQGRYEMGPRALGNRSLLASPFDEFTRDRLNRIKQREGYRPIAPVCLDEDLGQHFADDRPSPHMLYFQRVKSDRLAAVTHIDGSARVQTVNEHQNEALYSLLQAFKRRTGFGVLCNTSLNFKGKGFINRMSDLVRYQEERGVDGFVVGRMVYLSQAR